MSGFQLRSVSDGITALAGGGQTGAPVMTADYTNVGTVATTADSVQLPVSQPGMIRFIKNSGANSMNVFPAAGDAINALSANTALAVASVTMTIFLCMKAGTWHSK